MPEVLERTDLTQRPSTGLPGPAVTETGERLAREALRRQIAALERRLGELFATAFPRRGFEWGIGAVGGPRLLSSAELERVRDALVTRLREAQIELGRQADVEESKRELLERMIESPGEHRWLVISHEEIGERGCGRHESRPRWGLLGMLRGWWRIRLSSGCPLAEGPRPPAFAAKTSSFRSRSSWQRNAARPGRDDPRPCHRPQSGRSRRPPTSSRASWRPRPRPGRASRSRRNALRPLGDRFRWSSSSWRSAW